MYPDGSVRLGTDVLKVLALGARAVFLGRSVLWGLAYQVQRNSLEIFEITGKKLLMFRDMSMGNGKVVRNTFIRFCLNRS